MLSATLKIFQWALDFLRPALRKCQIMSEVRFGSPKDLSTEPFLTWWHIPVMVKVKRGWRGLKDNTVGFCMKLIMVLVVVLLAMPTGSYGMDSHNRYVIRRIGGHSCAEYNQTRQNFFSRLAFWNWVSGYVTA